MSYLWDMEALLQALEGEIFGPCPLGIKDIVIDSRKDITDAAFFCIKGNRFDGHDFAYEAYQKGAALLVINQQKADMFNLYPDKEKICYILVDDVLKALYRLAKCARERAQGKIIAITGSVGKTTTKELLRHSLRYSGKIHASPASFNNHWGVPLSLARFPKDADFGIFEIGMSRAGEIRSLGALVKPHIGIITKIAPSHLENFPSLEDIAYAKAELFETMVQGGTVLLNGDDNHYLLLRSLAAKRADLSVYSFGQAIEADYRLLSGSFEGEGSLLRVSWQGKETSFYLSLAGAHNQRNALGVIAVLDKLGVDIVPLLAHFSLFEAVDGRGTRYKLAVPASSLQDTDLSPSLILLDESYNANPTSMIAALNSFAHYSEKVSGEKILVLGDMLELGQESAHYHCSLAETLQALRLDKLFLVGDAVKLLHDKIMMKTPSVWRKTSQEILPLIQSHLAEAFALKPKDQAIMLVKSSHGVETFKIVHYLLQHYQIVE